MKAMEVSFREGIAEWGVSASYYARYFSIYALFQKLGIKCEIHDCTIVLFKYLFRDKLDPGLISELERAKEDRVEAQYYTKQVVVDEKKIIEKTKNFVLEVERISDGLNHQEIALLVKKFKQTGP